MSVFNPGIAGGGHGRHLAEPGLRLERALANDQQLPVVPGLSPQ
jgi:hypothetical protein